MRGKEGRQAADVAMNLVRLLPNLQSLSKILPPRTLAWKLELLQQGNRCPSLPPPLSACGLLRLFTRVFVEAFHARVLHESCVS